jgi:hypothetical protein
MQDASGWVEALFQELDSEPDTDITSREPGVGYSKILGRNVRTGPWDDQGISTFDKIRIALETGDMTAAAEQLDMFMDEASVIFSFFRQLIPDAMGYLREHGMTLDELRDLNSRLLALLRLPDGRAFSARRLWEEFRADHRKMLLLCGGGDGGDALTELPEYKEQWRRIQDRDVDHLYGLINEVVERYGEEALGEFWEAIIGPLFETRYAKFDISKFPWEDSLPVNLYLAFEAMRGHLVGPGRLGNMEFEEDDDRYTFRFDPCGSGSRALRGDTEIEGTPSRMLPPYNFGVTSEEHDFAWNKKGICYYCSNCCLVMQLKPIEAFGYPVRVVEPPVYPATADAKCTWHVYKDPRKTPEEFYRAVGRAKPAEFET